MLREDSRLGSWILRRAFIGPLGPRVAVGLLFRDPLRSLFLLLLGRLGLLVHGRQPIVAHMSELEGWRLCPRCGSALERGDGRARCSDCGSVYYASSKATACALCVDERGRVLLARRANEPFKDRWDLPGGFLEEGEHPLDGVRRELREETGLEVAPLTFLGVWMDQYPYGTHTASTLNLYWTARVLRGSPEPADDVSELAWFARDQLPAEEELAFHIGDVLRTWRNEHA